MKMIPWRPNMTPDEKRARHNARLFKQGWTMFRFDTPRGHIVQVHEIDLELGMAYGRGLRGRNRKALLSKIFPMPIAEKAS